MKRAPYIFLSNDFRYQFRAQKNAQNNAVKKKGNETEKPFLYNWNTLANILVQTLWRFRRNKNVKFT